MTTITLNDDARRAIVWTVVDDLKSLAESLTAECETERAAIVEAAGEEFNVNSTPQLRTVLFEKLALAPQKKTKTGYSTDADVILFDRSRTPLDDWIAVREAVRTHGTIRVVTEEQHAAALQAQAGLVVGKLQEFRQPGRKHLFLLSVQEQTSAPVL